MSTYYNNLLRRIRVLESIIYEGKKDQEVLQNFLGPEYYDKFQIVKNKISDPEYKDIYKIVKKDPNEVKDYIDNVQSQSDKRRDDKKGAKLLYEDPEWKVYKITTYPAAQLYGKGTKWCITGRYPGHEGRGEEYFYDYINDYNLDGGYYFYINKKNPSLKYCVLQTRNNTINSIWDAKDTNRGTTKYSIASDDVNLPEVDGINLPAINKYDFFDAVEDGDVDVIKAMLNSGKIDTNEKSKALFIASGNYNAEIIELLLDAGADPNIQVEDNETPLMNAVSYDSEENVKLLLDAGADPNIKSAHNSFALMIATDNRSDEIVAILLDAGADPNMREYDGGPTPLFDASDNGSTEIVELLLNAGANPNMKDKDGDTALMAACLDDNIETVKLLLDAGADPNKVNNDGSTAFSLAEEYSSDEIINLLNKYRAK